MEYGTSKKKPSKSKKTMIMVATNPSSKKTKSIKVDKTVKKKKY